VEFEVFGTPRSNIRRNQGAENIVVIGVNQSLERTISIMVEHKMFLLRCVEL